MDYITKPEDSTMTNDIGNYALHARYWDFGNLDNDQMRYEYISLELSREDVRPIVIGISYDNDKICFHIAIDIDGA